MPASKAEGCHITPHKDTTQTRQKYICFKEKGINTKYREHNQTSIHIYLLVKCAAFGRIFPSALWAPIRSSFMTSQKVLPTNGQVPSNVLFRNLRNAILKCKHNKSQQCSHSNSWKISLLFQSSICKKVFYSVLKGFMTHLFLPRSIRKHHQHQFNI